jgi:hypothetical protein
MLRRMKKASEEKRIDSSLRSVAEDGQRPIRVIAITSGKAEWQDQCHQPGLASLADEPSCHAGMAWPTST